jgi:hypothetical protein
LSIKAPGAKEYLSLYAISPQIRHEKADDG